MFAFYLKINKFIAKWIIQKNIKSKLAAERSCLPSISQRSDEEFAFNQISPSSQNLITNANNPPEQYFSHFI